MMRPLSAYELTIIDSLWDHHGYFVDRTFRYCQALIAWAIEMSKSTLDRPRIRVESPLYYKLTDSRLS